MKSLTVKFLANILMQFLWVSGMSMEQEVIYWLQWGTILLFMKLPGISVVPSNLIYPMVLSL